MTNSSLHSTSPAIIQALEHLAAAGLSFEIVERCNDAACGSCGRRTVVPAAA